MPRRAFNQVFSIRLRGPAKLAALRQTLQELVNRHDALRTTFLSDGSGQRILPHLKIDVPFQDLSSVSGSDPQRSLAEAMALEDQTLFDLVRGPLFRARILKVSEADHAIVIAAHHIVLDGWSIGVLIREFSRLYESLNQGMPVKVEPAMQYGQYLQWRGAVENRAEFDAAEAYWVGQYSRLPNVIELPGDRPRPAVKTYRAANQSLLLGSNLSDSLRQAARAQDCTLFVYLLASLKVLLHRLTGQDDLVVGIHAAGQATITGESGSNSLVGHCVNLLPVRSQCDDAARFTDYLKTLKSLTLDAYEHQNFTFGGLVKELGLPRDPSRVPLIPLAFNVTRIARNSRSPDFEPTFPKKGFNFFDASIEVADSGQDLRINCRFNTDLFDSGTIERWLDHWKTLLGGAIANPEQIISALPILNEDEHRQIVVDWNQTEVDYPSDRCLHELIEEQVERTPDATAAVFEGISLTYRQLNDRSNQLARHLQKLGVGPDSLVGLCIERLSRHAGRIARHPQGRRSLRAPGPGVSQGSTRLHASGRCALPFCSHRSNWSNPCPPVRLPFFALTPIGARSLANPRPICPASTVRRNRPMSFTRPAPPGSPRAYRFPTAPSSISLTPCGANPDWHRTTSSWPSPRCPLTFQDWNFGCLSSVERKSSSPAVKRRATAGSWRT